MTYQHQQQQQPRRSVSPAAPTRRSVSPASLSAASRISNPELTHQQRLGLAMTPGPIVLIDNSFLFIEGKKRAGIAGRENPLWRVNIGKLIEFVLRE